MADFAQFKPAERQLSDVTSVQAPVQDTSAATRMSSIAQGVSSLGQAGLTAFKISEQQEQAELELQQEQALMEQKQSFEKELLRAKDMADQHGSTSLSFKTFLTMAYDQSQLDPDTKAKMLKNFQSTVLGKSFTELSPEEKAFRKLREEAGANGYYTPNSSEEEVEAGIAEFTVAQRQADADAAELRRINLERAQLGLTRDQQTQLDREIGQKQFNAVANLAANYRTPVKNGIGDVINALNKGELTSKEAQEALRLKKGELEAVIAQMSRNVKDRSSVESLSKPLLDLYDFAIENTDSENILGQLKTQNAIMVEQVKFNQLSGNPQLTEVVALSSLVGHNNPALFTKMTPMTAEILRKNSNESEKPADVTEDSVDTKTYLDMMSNSINRVGILKPNGQPEVDQDELVVNINNTLLGANRYIDPEDPPTQNKQILQWLAQPKVGEYIKDNMSKLTPAARVKLSDTLINNAVNYVYPRVEELTSSLFTETKQPFRGRTGRSVGVTEDEVEMVTQGTSVVFRGSSPEGQRVADTMNREVAGALSTYFNATANVSGDSFTSVFERERQLVWPSKYSTETGTVEQEEETNEE